jgi:hypothetical protein
MRQLGLVLCLCGTIVAQPACDASKATSVSIEVSWPEVPDSDLYYVALTATASSQQSLMLQTTAQTRATLDDLLPNTTYYLRVRSHTSFSPSIVWNWRNFSLNPVACSTTPTPRGAPHSLRRLGSKYNNEFPHQSQSPHSTDSISMEWTPAKLKGAVSSPQHWQVIQRPLSRTRNFAWTAAVKTTDTRATVTDLTPGTPYELKVRNLNTGTESDPVRFRTAAEGMVYTGTNALACLAL